MRTHTLTLALLLIALVPCGAFAVTHVVDASGGGDFETVQAAVDASVTGDTLLIRAGIYEENILVVGPCLTWVGEGAGLTVIRASAAGPAIELQNLDAPPAWFTMSGFTVESHIGDPDAVVWDEGSGRFTDCEFTGDVGGGDAWGGIEMENCTAPRAHARGGDRISTITDCHLEELAISGISVFGPGGASYWSASHVDVEYSTIDDVTLTGASIDATGSTIGEIAGVWEASRCRAVDCELGPIQVGSGSVVLDGCTVSGDIIGQGWMDYGSYHTGYLHIIDTVVDGGITIDLECYAESPFGSVNFTHATIAGAVSYEVDSWDGEFVMWPYHMRSSLFLGDVYLPEDPDWYWTVATHNDFVGGFVVPPADSVFANFSADPLLCGIVGYDLQECSPCAGAAHDGGDIGALGVGCPCATPVEPKSWGAIKALYR